MLIALAKNNKQRKTKKTKGGGGGGGGGGERNSQNLTGVQLKLHSSITSPKNLPEK